MIFWDCKKALSLFFIFSLILLSFSCSKKEKVQQEEKSLLSNNQSVSPAVSDVLELPSSLEDALLSEDAKASAFPDEESLTEEIPDSQEEEERITASLDEMKNALPEDEAEDEPEEEKTALDFCGKDSFLLFSELDNEVIERGFEDGYQTLVYSIGGKVKKNFYDGEYRLAKSEFWEISTLSDSRIVKSELYEYHNSNKKPFLKLIKYDSKIDKIFYSENNLIEKSESYKIVRDKPYITKISLFKYDSQGRQTEIKNRDFSYNDEEDTKRRSVFEKVIKYRYNQPDAQGNEIPPNMYYYENGELKSYENYTSVSGTYTMGYYFDKKYSVVTVYQNNQKIREIIYLDGNPVRIHRKDDPAGPEDKNKKEMPAEADDIEERGKNEKTDF